MQNPQFEKVKLLAIGQKTNNGQTIDPPFLAKIYNSEQPNPDHFYTADPNEIIDFSKDGRVYYAIENNKGEIVGATAMQFQKSKIKTMWKRGYVGRTHIIAKYRGNGYSGSSKIALRNIIEKQGFKKLHTYIKRKNQASINAVCKVGFRYNLARTLCSIDFNFFDKRYLRSSLAGNWYEVYTWKF